MLAARCLSRLTRVSVAAASPAWSRVTLPTPMSARIVAPMCQPVALWGAGSNPLQQLLGLVRFRKVNIKGSIKKRFSRASSSGKIKRGATGRAHNTGKHRPRTTRLRAQKKVIHPSDMRRINRMLPK